ncbi:MAG: hypothetical protein JWM28_712, partial [Chitinophagaceae bacterium]|nr:hypothetical protein [Chitinophagaceae bacterium]
TIRTIASNFDIICRIQSVRVPAIKENLFNQPELTWNFTINPPASDKVIIGILDNGVKDIPPLHDLIVDYGLDITDKINPDPLRVFHYHGTAVAMLAAIGLDYFNTAKTNFQADARIVPIKILNFDTGCFNIYDIEAAIREAANRGVRIFNLSVSGPSKMYNADISEYAYVLDKLSYENDILIFIATGNLSGDDMEAMASVTPAGKNRNLHTYPYHFYNPFKQSDEHVCEATNLCQPSESFNNISVGALAENLIPGSPFGLTPLKELPAYYTRKFYIDYSKKVNGSLVANKQVNHNINKPDIVMPGGDMMVTRSRMQVTGLGEIGTDYYKWDAGTSFASPLAANLAAKIITQYPAMNMQSAKALVINSADYLLDKEFLEVSVTEIKNELAISLFKKRFDLLEDGDRRKISARLSSEILYHKLAGKGMPDPNKVIFSDRKRVTVVIQDSIALASHKVVNLNIPAYLLKYKKAGYILILKATLCYKFLPVWNNQLGYNPLHISFNFLKSLKKDNPVRTADILTDRGHRYYNQFTQGLTTDQDKLKAKKEALGIKKSLQPWSEDFFPPSSKPFSNTQQHSLNITKEEIEKVNNQISIAVRCTYKRGLDQSVIDNLSKSLHEFSIVITIEEKKNTQLENFDLYDELVAINQLDTTLIQAAEAEDDLDADL